MPKGQEFSKDVKQTMFRVITFVEKEKNGPTIPLYSVNERLHSMLGISKQSITNFKSEMRELQRQKDVEEESRELQTRSRTSSSVTLSHRKQDWSSSSPATKANILKALPPRKKGHSGGKSIPLSEYAEDMIRLQFHTILSKKEYPTTAKLLLSLKSDHPDFPITSRTTLWRHMKRV
jgi:Sec-independent protein translocase protein TatA